MAATDLHPLFLDLRDRRVVVVGGGPVAAARVERLRATGAELLVVAPEVRPEIVAAGVEIRRRPFEPSDLDGAWFAVVAAVPGVARLVRAAADARQIFVNAVDDPAEASAFAGAVLRRDGVAIAVSTGGRAPALAGLLGERLDALLPAGLGALVERAEALRAEWKAAGLPLGERRAALARALADALGPCGG